MRISSRSIRRATGLLALGACLALGVGATGGEAEVAADDATLPAVSATKARPAPAPASPKVGPEVPVVSEEVGVGFTYVPVDPYRTWDTRFLGEGTPLPGGFVEFFTVLTDIQDVQRIPSDAVAVTYNLTVTETVGGGFAAIYPADIAWPGTSAINWTTSGTTVANAGTIAIGDFAGAVGAVEVFVEPAGSSTHYLIDITGYYVS